MKHFSFRLAAINVCPVLVPSELLLSTHIPTSEGWTAELAVDLWLVVPTTGFEPRRVDLACFETLRLNHSATPPDIDMLGRLTGAQGTVRAPTTQNKATATPGTKRNNLRSK